MVTLKSVACRISITDSIAVFPCKGDAEAWARNGGVYNDAYKYNGEIYPVVFAGTFTCTRWFPADGSWTVSRSTAVSGPRTVFIKEYETEQIHPRIRVPYMAWGVVVSDH